MSINEIFISDLGRIVTGKTPSTKNPVFFDGDYQFVTPSDLDWKTYYCQSTERTVTDEAKKHHRGQFIPAESVMVSCIATVGKCAISSCECLTNQQINSIIPNESISTKFIYYLLTRSMDLIRGIAIGGGVAVPIINKTTFSKIKLQVPSSNSWDNIATTLSAYDDLIDNNRRRIRLLEKAARLLYKEWFVRLRFPGHERVSITDGVPEWWETCGVMEHPHFEFIGGSVDSFDGHKRYYATADISGIFITGNGIDYTFEAKPSRAQKAPEVGSVWFARMQETYKVLVFTETNRDMTTSSMLSSGFAGFRARRPEFLPFLYLLVNNERFHKEKDLFCTGATQRSLTNGGLARIRVLAPTTNVVCAFAELVGPMIEQILTLQAVNQQLGAARDLLLPRLMDGRIAV